MISRIQDADYSLGKLHSIFLLTIAGLFTVVGVVSAEQTAIGIPKGDPAMKKAEAFAKTGVKDFLTKFRAGNQGMESPSIKIRRVEGKASEAFWVSNISERNAKLSGSINDDLHLLKKLKYGDHVEFKEEDIVDWMYLSSNHDRMFGNATACPELDKMPDQAKELLLSLKLDCSFLRK